MAKKDSFTIVLPKETTPVAKITNYSEGAQAGITANPDHFKAPSPTVQELKDATDVMVAADVADTLVNDTTRLTLKNKKKAVLEILKKMAAFVIGAAKGDRYIASLSGFQLSKEETSPKPQTEILIKDTMVGPGDGQATVRLASRGGHDMFIVELKQADDSWKMIGAFTLSTFVLTGLASGSSVIRITGYKSDVMGKVVETVVKAV
jgi:translation initiation factor IF-1